MFNLSTLQTDTWRVGSLEIIVIGWHLKAEKDPLLSIQQIFTKGLSSRTCIYYYTEVN